MSWTFHLADTPTMSEIGLLRMARERSVDWVWNRPGKLAFTQDLDDPTNLAAYVREGATCVIGRQNGAIRWSGPVWACPENLTQNTQSVTCMGWLEVLNHRELSQDMTFTNVDAGVIIFALLDDANAAYPTYISKGTRVDSQVRTVVYKKGTNIGQEIQKLCDIEAGVDIEIDPATRAMNIYAYKGQSRPDVKYGYNIMPRNLASATRNRDLTRTTNSIRVIGKVGSVVVEDASYMDKVKLKLQETASLTEVVNTNILTAFGQAELAVRGMPFVSYEISPKMASVASVPKMFTDVFPGDTVLLSMEKGYVVVSDQAVRLFDVSLALHDNSVEQWSLSLMASA